MISFEDIKKEVDTNFPEISNEPLAIDYINFLVKHINLVNKYAEKIGKSYPDHDRSKYTQLFPAYCLTVKKDRTEEEQAALDMATLIHVKTASHHPEYWTKTDLTGFTRKNFTPNGVIDATDMPQEAIDQMICDWEAVGEVKGNSGLEWFNKINGTRWKFNAEQQMYIRLLIDKLENN